MAHIKRIPAPDIEFNSFLVIIEVYLNVVPGPGADTNAERLGTNALALSVFNETFAKWETNWTLYDNKDTKTKTVIDDKDDLRDEIEPLVREIQNKAEVSDNITNQARVILRVPKRDDIRTRIEAPTVAPDMTIEKREFLKAVIRFHNPDDPDTKAKPNGVEGVEVFQYIGDNPPAFDEWTFIGSTGRFLFPITYMAEEAKMTAHIVSRYRNPRGEVGPWSDPIVVDIS